MGGRTAAPAVFSGRCVQVRCFGGPEVLTPGHEQIDPPGEGEVIIRHTRIGVNFADTYQRQGEIHNDALSPPFIPGLHGVGEVVAVGLNAGTLKTGERVTHVGGPGAYAEYRRLPAQRLVGIPEDIDDDAVAAVYARGLTCQYLLRQLHRVQPGEAILVHAAAGGLGQLLVRWAKHLGAIVIGTVGSHDKARRIEAMGCDLAIVYTQEDFAGRVLEYTRGVGVSVVYDSVGADTFQRSLACTAPRGLVVNYGTASGPVPPIVLQDLHGKSLSVCRPTLRNWIATTEALQAASHDVFAMMRAGVLAMPVDRVLDLYEAQEAHRLLASRTLSGAVLLRT